MDKGAVRRAGGATDVATRVKAVQVATIARALVGVKTGQLRSSIRVTRSRSPNWNVEAGRQPLTPWALVHHTGRRALPRKSPSDAKPLYVFEINGQTVFTPGPIKEAKPNPYLVDAARQAGLRVTLRGGR